MKQRISAVMKWCIAQGFRDDNPADDRITAALGSNTQRPLHMKALPHKWSAQLFGRSKQPTLTGQQSPRSSSWTLTATRSGEVRNAIWDEIDLTTASGPSQPSGPKHGESPGA